MCERGSNIATQLAGEIRGAIAIAVSWRSVKQIVEAHRATLKIAVAMTAMEASSFATILYSIADDGWTWIALLYLMCCWEKTLIISINSSYTPQHDVSKTHWHEIGLTSLSIGAGDLAILKCVCVRWESAFFLQSVEDGKGTIWFGPFDFSSESVFLSFLFLHSPRKTPMEFISGFRNRSNEKLCILIYVNEKM